MTTPSPITDWLRARIRERLEDGDSILAMSRRSGMTNANMSRFVHGHASVSLETADRIADMLGGLCICTGLTLGDREKLLKKSTTKS